jgi:hypothetical protein
MVGSIDLIIDPEALTLGEKVLQIENPPLAAKIMVSDPCGKTNLETHELGLGCMQWMS